jgi:hypothetical protein
MRNRYWLPISLLVAIMVLGSLAGCSNSNTSVLQSSSDIEKAREALLQFFSLLHLGRYGEATAYYGGDYSVLSDWNPEVPADDYATLFENACTVNGLQCLETRTVSPGIEVAAGLYQFSVDFVAPDGSVFARGAERQFTYTVLKVDDRFLVQELPVYVP